MSVLLMCAAIGIAAGWATGRALKGNQSVPAMDIVMGIVGAVGTGLLVMRFATNLQVIAATFFATLGAIAMTVFGAYLNGRKSYA
jgi:uncharacterized membrane protein YeaQ/YmgE (transglycosylase-associated protein family)